MVSLTGSQNVLHFELKRSKSLPFLGLRPRRRWGAYNAPSDPLVVRDFLPSAIAVSRPPRSISPLPPNKKTNPANDCGYRPQIVVLFYFFQTFHPISPYFFKDIMQNFHFIPQKFR